MKTVSGTRIVVVVGARPRASAPDILGDLGLGDEAAVFILGLDPTSRQRRFTDDGLLLAAERRFELTAELIPATSWLQDRLRVDDQLRVLAGRRESWRWGLQPGSVSAFGA